ncbi:hypothetical protein FRC07_007589 [Ceratobasidium sp. 392]|nr:hypothetical protein FRC07_007589 [Ceratobasidium sp. 392]
MARDLPQGAWDHRSLLQKLRQYRDAWLDVELGHSIQQNYGDEDMPLWELRDGIFVKAFSNSNIPQTTNSLCLFPLGDTNTSTQVDFGIDFAEFNIDPSQDLVVLVGTNPGEQFVIPLCFLSILLHTHRAIGIFAVGYAFTPLLSHKPTLKPRIP